MAKMELSLKGRSWSKCILSVSREREREREKERELSITHSSCCSLGNPLTIDPEPASNKLSEIEKAASDSIREQTGLELWVLCDQPSQLNAMGNPSDMKWVQMATIVDSGAVRHVTPNGVLSLTTEDSQRAREGHNYDGPAGEQI